MLTVKFLGNVLVCDDKDSVSLLDPLTMQILPKIPLPADICYLYSAYKHVLANTIFLSFDNKQLLLIDSKNFKNKQLIKLDMCIYQFTEFHADPNNYMILACEKGTI